MFSLIKFDNGDYWITPSKNVSKNSEGRIFSKFRGGRYASKLILKSDDKNYLMECKIKFNNSTKNQKSQSNINDSSHSKTVLCDDLHSFTSNSHPTTILPDSCPLKQLPEELKEQQFQTYENDVCMQIAQPYSTGLLLLSGYKSRSSSPSPQNVLLEHCYSKNSNLNFSPCTTSSDALPLKQLSKEQNGQNQLKSPSPKTTSSTGEISPDLSPLKQLSIKQNLQSYSKPSPSKTTCAYEMDSPPSLKPVLRRHISSRKSSISCLTTSSEVNLGSKSYLTPLTYADSDSTSDKQNSSFISDIASCSISSDTLPLKQLSIKQNLQSYSKPSLSKTTCTYEMDSPPSLKPVLRRHISSRKSSISCLTTSSEVNLGSKSYLTPLTYADSDSTSDKQNSSFISDIASCSISCDALPLKQLSKEQNGQNQLKSPSPKTTSSTGEISPDLSPLKQLSIKQNLQSYSKPSPSKTTCAYEMDSPPSLKPVLRRHISSRKSSISCLTTSSEVNLGSKSYLTPLTYADSDSTSDKQNSSFISDIASCSISSDTLPLKQLSIKQNLQSYSKPSLSKTTCTYEMDSPPSLKPVLRRHISSRKSSISCLTTSSEVNLGSKSYLTPLTYADSDSTSDKQNSSFISDIASCSISSDTLPLKQLSIKQNLQSYSKPSLSKTTCTYEMDSPPSLKPVLRRRIPSRKSSISCLTTSSEVNLGPKSNLTQLTDADSVSTSDKQNSSFITDTASCSKFSLNSTGNIDTSVLGSSMTSEYIPDTTSEIINSTNDNSVGQNTSTDVIEKPVKISEVIVPHRNRQIKAHFCIFCKTMQTHLPRHFFAKHSSEKKIKEAMHLPIKSQQRLNIISELRKQGNFLHNTSEEYNTGILIVSRRQQKKMRNTAREYVCCKNCKAFFAKSTLRIHLRRCGNKKNSRDNLICGRKLTQYMHPSANVTLRTKIFPVLRCDQITRAIQYDELVIKYGNKLSEKYTLTHQHDMIRAHLRLLGRFVIEIKKLNNNIRELKDIYKPNLFDACVTALRKVANWDDELLRFRTPAVAQQMTSLIKKCGSKQRTEFIKSKEEDLKKELDDFLLLWDEDIPVQINKKASDDQYNRKREKKVILPSKADIKKLYVFLKNKMFDSIHVLQNRFDIDCWNDLVKASLIFIQIFNRRRAGEIERLTINSYINKEMLTKDIEAEILQSMSKDSVTFAKQFVRLSLRGKLGRTVSVLLSPLCTKAIDLILQFRAKAGISEKNEYIFCKQVSSKFSKPYYRACPLLKQFSLECGAEIPETLRGTTLRKHIATYISSLNVEEATVDTLANFMGHHKDIHKSIYRVSIPVAEITTVSQLLTSAIGNDDGEEDDEEGEEEGEDEEEREYKTSNSENTSSKMGTNPELCNKKRRSTSPFGKTRRRKWLQEEKDALISFFGDLNKLKKLPSTRQCFDAIKQNSVLKKRTALQIKTWIDNQRRCKLKDNYKQLAC